MVETSKNEALKERVRGLFQTVENLGFLRRFQKNFYALTGLPFDLVDLEAHPSRRLKDAKDFTPFRRLILRSAVGRAAFFEFNCEVIRRLREKPHPTLYPDPMGFMEMVVPLVMGGQLIGALASGQFLLRKPGRQTFHTLRSKIRNLGVPLALAEKHYLNAPVLTPEKADAVVDLLALIADHLLKIEVELYSLEKHHDSEPIYRAKKFIENHFSDEIALRDVAAAAHLSPSRLAHLFREKMNTSFVAYRNELRIEKTKFLLANTDLQIVEIAMKSGFFNLGHFNELFKKEVGVSPREYRHQHISVSL